MANSHSYLRDSFIDITGTTAENATKWLERFDWRIEPAINEYLKKKSNQSSAKDLKKFQSALTQLFDQYKDPSSPETIGIDGTIQYMEDMGYEPEDVIGLCLAEFLESPAVGVFNKRDFIEKWADEKISTLSQMSSFLKSLKTDLEGNTAYFKGIYTFTFGFLMEGPQRSLPLELAIDYWTLLFGAKYQDRLDLWFRFLNEEWKKSISKDVWNMFLPFIHEFNNDPKLAAYDETAAWPSLMDQFVEYLRDYELI